MTGNNNIILSNGEDVNVNDDQVNMDEDGYGEEDGGDCGGAHDDGDDQPQATAVVVAPTTRPQRSISKRP